MMTKARKPQHVKKGLSPAPSQPDSAEAVALHLQSIDLRLGLRVEYLFCYFDESSITIKLSAYEYRGQRCARLRAPAPRREMGGIRCTAAGRLTRPAQDALPRPPLRCRLDAALAAATGTDAVALTPACII